MASHTPPAALIDQIIAERFFMHLSSTGQAVHTAIAAATQHCEDAAIIRTVDYSCLLYTSPSPRDGLLSRMQSSA